jgi:hypothetical protein
MKIPKFFSSEIFLFGIVLAVMFFHFHGIFQITDLPGWDTDSHFVALSKMANEFLPSGTIQGYMPEWFGGIPLFQFYAPLYFILVAGLWIFSGKIIPLIFLFRISLFVSVFLISISLWFFTKTAFGKNAGKWSILLSLFAIFYPLSGGQNGIGVGGVISSGLITGSIGFSLLLVQFALLLKISRDPSSKKYFALHTAIVAVIALTHTLSFIGSIIGIVFFLLYFHKNNTFLLLCGASAVIGVGIASFWTIPFFSHIDLSSSSVVLMQGDPLITMFPFNPKLLFSIETIPYFNFWALGLFFTTIYGLYILLFKKNERIIPFLFLFFFIFIVRNLISTVFPSMTVHFYRFSPVLFLLVLSLSSFALDFFQKTYIKNKKHLGIFLLLCVSLVTHGQMTFPREANNLDPLNTDPYYSKILINWSFNDTPYYLEGKEMLSRLAKKTDMNKLLVVVPAETLSGYFGSPHYFDSMLVLKNKQNSISGLYAESSPLTPFIMPTIRALGENKVLAWGESQLSLLSDFINQPYTIHLKRIFDVGVNYIVSSDLSITSKLLMSQMVTLEEHTEHFFVFKAREYSPNLFTPYTLPFAYIQGKEGIEFREIAKAVYAGKTTYNLPILNLKDISLDIFSHETDKTLFSGLIFSEKNIKDETLVSLEKISIPVIIVSNDIDDDDITAHPSLRFITNFESIEENFSHIRNNPIYGWHALQQNLETLSIKNSTSTPALASFSSKKITIETNGPLSILNIGYSPYWKIKNCDTCRIFEVSPARIAIQGSGIIELAYDTSDTATRTGNYLSILSLIALFGIGIFWKKIKK